jgi:uncharacterized membrane protein YbhN (UPF0104 family)
MNLSTHADGTEPGDAAIPRAGSLLGQRRGVWRWLGMVVVALVVFFLVRQVARSWPAVRAYPWRWHWGYLILSLVAIQLAYLTLARSWRSVLRAIRVQLPYTTAYWIFYLSNLGRYLPGKVWQIGAAALLGKRLGLSGTHVAASMIVHVLYFLPMGVALALASGGFPPPYDDLRFRVIAWSLGLATACAALWPHFLLRMAAPVARKLKIQPERWRIEILRRIYIAVQTTFAWLCLSAGFTFFVLSVTPLAPGDWSYVARVYIAAHVIGYVTLLAPGGIGVREGVIAVLLQPLLGAGPAAGLALLSRLWITITEVVAVMPALAWARRDFKGNRS